MAKPFNVDSTVTPDEINVCCSIATDDEHPVYDVNLTDKGHDEQFVDSSMTRTFLCAMCDLVLRRPLQLTCGHRFCSSCLYGYREYQRLRNPNTLLLCPIDRTELEMDKAFEDKAAYRDVQSLHVRCRSTQVTETKDTCGWVGELSDLEEHMRKCIAPVACCNSGCTEWIPRKDVDLHQDVCPFKRLDCPFQFIGCGSKVLRKNIEEDPHNHRKIVADQILLHRNRLRDQQAKYQTIISTLELRIDECIEEIEVQQKTINKLQSRLDAVAQTPTSSTSPTTPTTPATPTSPATPTPTTNKPSLKPKPNPNNKPSLTHGKKTLKAPKTPKSPLASKKKSSLPRLVLPTFSDSSSSQTAKHSPTPTSSVMSTPQTSSLTSLESLVDTDDRKLLQTAGQAAVNSLDERDKQDVAASSSGLPVAVNASSVDTKQGTLDNRFSLVWKVDGRKLLEERRQSKKVLASAISESVYLGGSKQNKGYHIKQVLELNRGGAHIYVYVLPGKNDDHLRWPFDRTFAVSATFGSRGHPLRKQVSFAGLAQVMRDPRPSDEYFNQAYYGKRGVHLMWMSELKQQMKEGDGDVIVECRMQGS